MDFVRFVLSSCQSQGDEHMKSRCTTAVSVSVSDVHVKRKSANMTISAKSSHSPRLTKKTDPMVLTESSKSSNDSIHVLPQLSLQLNSTYDHCVVRP